jgi:hypothetical protein
MQSQDLHGRAAAAGVSLVLMCACLTLASCGGSSSTKADAATSSTSAPASGTVEHHAPASSPFSAMRACLKAHGIALPATSARTRRPGAPGVRRGAPARGRLFFGGHAPGGASATRMREAFRACGGGAGLRPRLRRYRASRSPAFKTALSRFAACVRKHGVTLPKPNSSGNGPVFDTKGLDVGSAKFKAAVLSCRSMLSGVIGGKLRHGAPGGGPPVGPPPGGEPGVP